MEFHQQLTHQQQLQPHVQWGNDPPVANHNGILSTTHARKTVETPFTMRNRSDHDPRPIRPWSDHTRDRHRSSTFGDGLCLEKQRLSYLKNAFRARLPSKLHRQLIHSTTCKPIYSERTILELQITMEFHQQLTHQHHLQPHLQCGNDPPVANHNGLLSTTHARKTVETPFTMRNRSENDPRISENDPTTHETVSHPSRRRGRSSSFGDGLCMEKQRLSFICYLSKTHFVREFLQNSIGNSSTSCKWDCKPQWNSSSNFSTSTTCNPIYNAGTILQLQITIEFCRPHMQKNSWNPIYNAEPIREYPRMIRPHETVLHPSRRRGRSSTSGDGLCVENIGFRTSAIS